MIKNYKIITWFTKRGLNPLNKDISMKLYFLVLTLRMSSRLWISGESPPCTQRNCWFMRAASGRQSNASMQASYTLSEYFILPASRETTRQQRTNVSRVRFETTNSIRARLSPRAFFPFLSLSLYLFYRRVLPFCSSDAFCPRRATELNRGGGGGKKRKGVGGWVKFAFSNWLAVVWNIIMNGIFEKMLVQCECVPCQFFFFLLFL